MVTNIAALETDNVCTAGAFAQMRGQICEATQAKKLYNGNTSSYNWCKVIVDQYGEKGADEKH